MDALPVIAQQGFDLLEWDEVFWDFQYLIHSTNQIITLVPGKPRQPKVFGWKAIVTASRW